MNEREKYENGILTIRFIGEEFSERGVSIYDFASALLAIQRIINKAYLAKEGRLRKGAFPDKHDRERLSLSIGERRRESDAFSLIPLLADATTLEFVKKITDYVISGIVSYYVGDVIKRVNADPDENRQQFIGAIHADVVNIVNRIEAAGGVEAIEIGAPFLGKPVVAKFDERTKQYVNGLSNEYYLGKNQTFRGSVYRFYPNSLIVTVRRAGGRKVNVYLNQPDFDQIRYHTGIDPLVVFTGRPRYKFGIESQAITDFEASSIQIEREA